MDTFRTGGGGSTPFHSFWGCFSKYHRSYFWMKNGKFCPPWSVSAFRGAFNLKICFGYFKTFFLSFWPFTKKSPLSVRRPGGGWGLRGVRKVSIETWLFLLMASLSPVVRKPPLHRHAMKICMKISFHCEDFPTGCKLNVTRVPRPKLGRTTFQYSCCNWLDHLGKIRHKDERLHKHALSGQDFSTGCE